MTSIDPRPGTEGASRPDGLPEAGSTSVVEAHDAVSPTADRTALASNEFVANSFGEYASATFKRIRSGESGVLPVIVGLVLIVVIFQVENGKFLSGGNLTALLQQGSVFVLLGLAEVFVLLLGEIDLSIGFVAGIGAVIAAELVAAPHNFPWWLAVVVALAATSLIGLIQGLLITLLGLPSFIVTLAGLLGWEGFLQFLINADKNTSGGTISLTNNVLNDVVNGSLSPVVGWVVMAAIVALFAALNLLRDARRRSSGLVAPPLAVTGLKIVAMAVAGIVLVAVCNINRGTGLVVLRGVPWIVPIVLVILSGWTFLLGRTRYGRYLYAIGGNAEAARRAGISLTRIRVGAFVMTGLTAGIAGMAYLSRLNSISNNIDGGTLVLYAVASAVIGGTSLFGGRGRMIHAVLGGLVIATIYNGMGLIGLSSAAQLMVTALVLLAAVVVDAVARRGRTAV